MNLSLGVAIVMLVGKLFAFFVTQSTAILSDAAESVVHIFATAIAWFSVGFAERPPDERHPYGHGRIALLSVGLEGFLIFGASIYIVVVSVRALILGPELQSLDIGIAITSALTLTNLLLGLYLVRVGKREHSPVVTANGKHILTDMWTSAAVVAGISVVWLSGIVWLDPLIALVAGLNILRTGQELIREAIDMAMDQVRPEESAELDAALASIVQQGIISGYHQLRHRTVNDVRWVELHILVPGNLTVTEAHRRATSVERILGEVFEHERTNVLTHIEPDDHDLAHPEGHHDDPIGAYHPADPRPHEMTE
ncbi:MAG: cation transporter, partial [Bdellovibrionales bacterium]|nr:cation transporter [Bdellovibrionales bacterium]